MSWFRRRSEPVRDAPVPPGSDLETLTAIARTHLSADIAERWLRLLRPGVRISACDSRTDAVARIGGRPVVPDGFAWPIWQGSGPLSYIAEIDLEALAAQRLDPGVDLPRTGRLLAFYFEGSYDGFSSVVGTWDRRTLQGARLIHVSAPREVSAPLAAPEGVREFEEQWLGGRQIMTHPGWEHHLLRTEFCAMDCDFETWQKHPIQGEGFNEALFALEGEDAPHHQVGGWAQPLQGPVELEVAQAAIPEDVQYGSPPHIAEALAWRPLLQIDSDHASQMMWGDVGRLYWLRRDSDRAAAELGPVSFTWQCG